MKYTCINIYAPNIESERVMFFNEISTCLYNQFKCDNDVMGGDFNIVLDKKDKKGGLDIRQASSKTFSNILKEHGLVDIWRLKHPNLQRFTWIKNNPEIMCRLDFFLVSNNLVNNCKKAKIMESIKTDHKLIMLEVNEDQSNQKRVPGFWKFNNSLLEDDEFITEIENLYLNKIQDWVEISDLRVKWDLIKFEIQNYSIKYSKYKARERRRLEKDTLEMCDKFYSKLCDIGLNNGELEQYENYKGILENINKYKEQGSYIRSRSEFIEQNEKSTFYFYNKERESYNKKTITKIKIDDKYITSQIGYNEGIK